MTKKPFLKIKRMPLHKILLIFTLIYYFVFGSLMAFTAGQPDQSIHSYFSNEFSKTWGIPQEGNKFSSFIFTGQPYLYYWLNGLVVKVYLWLFPLNQPIRPVMLLRLFSAFLSLFTVYFTYKFASKVTDNPYAGVLTAFFLANTLMFVFVSGGINYDNLMNLAAMASLFYLVNVYKGEDFVKNTFLTGIWVIIGSLAKEQFLLLTTIIFLSWLYFVIRNYKNITLQFSKVKIIIGIIFIGFLVLFLGLYGTNLVRYSSVTPACIQIKPANECQSFSHRKEYYEPYDTRAIWFFRDNIPNFIEYAYQFWFYKMAQSIWGILSQNTFVPMFSVALHASLALWGFLCLVRYWKPKERIANLLIFVLLSYGLFILLMNYQGEVNFSFQHFAVSGRYFAPIYGAILTLMVYYFLKIKPLFLKRLTLALSIVLYFTGGFWMYISRYAEVFMHWRLYG